MKKDKKVDVRLTSTNLTQLTSIRSCGGFENDSIALRFCIQFTYTMLRILPASLAESYIKEQREQHELQEYAILSAPIGCSSILVSDTLP